MSKKEKTKAEYAQSQEQNKETTPPSNQVPRRLSERQLSGVEIVIRRFSVNVQTIGGSRRFSSLGHLVLNHRYKGARKALLRLILESANFMKLKMPPLFTPDAAELFYRDCRLEEVRLRGRNIVGFSAAGDPVYHGRTTNPTPAFGMDDLRIVLSERDQGRNFVAVFRKEESEKESAEDSLVVSWDLRDHEQLERMPGVAYVTLAVVPDHERMPRTLGDFDEKVLARMEEKLKDIPVLDLPKELHLLAPVEVSEHVLFEMSEPFRKLTYIYEKDEAKRQLAEHYADSADLSERAIREKAREQYIPFETAKALLMLDHLLLRDEFIEKNLDRFIYNTSKVLNDVFEVLLKHEVNNIVLADGPVQGMDLNRDPTDTRRTLRKDEDDLTRVRFGLPGRGRTPGTHPRWSEKKATAKRVDNKRRVEDAIRKLLLADVTRDEKRSLGVAMDDLTPEKVSKELGKSVSTLNRWVKQSWKDFEDAKWEIGGSLRIRKK